MLQQHGVLCLCLKFTIMEKTKIQELTELMEHLKEARECSRNLGRLYEYMYENEDGNLQIDFPHEARLDRCTVDWGDVVMAERCRSLVYTPYDEAHPLRFIFDYFYGVQSLWVFLERMSERDLDSIIYWIRKTINK